MLQLREAARAALAKGDNYGSCVIGGLLVVVHVATRDEKALHREAREALRTVFEELDREAASSAGLHRGTMLAMLMLFRDVVRRRDAELAEQLVARMCETGERRVA
jgi:hypothetical protein